MLLPCHGVEPALRGSVIEVLVLLARAGCGAPPSAVRACAPPPAPRVILSGAPDAGRAGAVIARPSRSSYGGAGMLERSAGTRRPELGDVRPASAEHVRVT